MSWKVRTTPGHSPWWSSPYASLQPLHMQSPNSHQVRTSRRSRVCESVAVPALRRVVLSLNSCRVARGNEKTDRVQQIAAEKENGARACSWLSRQKKLEVSSPLEHARELSSPLASTVDWRGKRGQSHNFCDPPGVDPSAIPKVM